MSLRVPFIVQPPKIFNSSNHESSKTSSYFLPYRMGKLINFGKNAIKQPPTSLLDLARFNLSIQMSEPSQPPYFFATSTLSLYTSCSPHLRPSIVTTGALQRENREDQRNEFSFIRENSKCYFVIPSPLPHTPLSPTPNQVFSRSFFQVEIAKDVPRLLTIATAIPGPQTTKKRTLKLWSRLFQNKKTSMYAGGAKIDSQGKPETRFVDHEKLEYRLDS